MKAKEYTAEELLNMDKSEVIKVYNRTAERINKRITRARARGVTPAATGRRRSRLSKKTKISKTEMIRRIQEMQAGADITVESMIADLARAYGNNSAEFKENLRRLLDEKPAEFSKIYTKYRDVMIARKTGKIQNWREIYYETLSVAVDNGEFSWFYPEDRRGSIWDKPSAENERAIMEKYDEILARELETMLERILNGV